MLHWRPSRVAVMIALVSSAAVGLPSSTMAMTLHSPPWADVISGPMWAGVDPRGAADTAVSYLHSAGYAAFDDNNNTSATQAIGSGWAQDDAIWVAYGHAGGGQITIEKNASGNPPQAGIGAVVANRSVPVSPDFSQGPKAYLYDLPYHTLSRVKLMVFIGCDTGNNGKTGSAYDGNLVKEVTGDQGVDSAVGFRYEIYFVPNAADLWNDAFFHSLKDGKTVSTAANDGRNNVGFWWGLWNNYWGFDNPYIIGGSVKITPAAYGS